MRDDKFRLGRYWLDHVAGSASWYRFWYDAGVGELRRRSLKTVDFEDAKLRLAAVVLKEGAGKAGEPAQVKLITVLTNYWERRCDHTRSRTTARLGGGKILDFVGNTASAAAFPRTKQREFFVLMRAEGYAIHTIASWMTLFSAALNFAVADDEDESGALLTRAPPVIYSAKAIAAALNEPEPEPRNWHPDIPMLAHWLDGLRLPAEQGLWRLSVLLLGFSCRPSAAMEAGVWSLDKRYHLVRLNPPDRRQTKKHRPTIPVADALWALLEQWSDAATFAHLENGRRIHNLSRYWCRARTRLSLPPAFIPYSLRHFMATELRHAHLRYGVQRVPADEREMFMGHRRLNINNIYGVYEPDYLSAAKVAVNAILLAVNTACQRPFLRQVSANTATPAEPKSHLKSLK